MDVYSGDILVQVNNNAIHDLSDVVQAVGIQPDKQIQLTIRRPVQEGQEEVINTVTLKSIRSSM